MERHCATCRCDPGEVCTCGHAIELHAFNRANTVRTACSVHTGRKNTPCGCLAYTPQEAT